MPGCITTIAPTEPIAIEKRDIASPIPILMVHGLAGRSYHFNVMRDRFVRAGWDPNLLYTINLSNPASGRVGINVEHAKEIEAKVDAIFEETGQSEINIIAHSMGTLSSMYYIKSLGGKDHVAHFVGLDGRLQPNRGFLRWIMPDTKKGTEVMTVLNTPDITPVGELPDTKYPDSHEPGDMGYRIFFQRADGNIFDGAEITRHPDVNHVAFLTDDEVFVEILDFFTD